jgi:hypothetical protein
MSTEERTRIAASLLGIKPEKVDDVGREVQANLRAMNQTQRADLSRRIDGVIDWVADYEAEEARIRGEN